MYFFFTPRFLLESVNVMGVMCGRGGVPEAMLVNHLTGAATDV